VKILDQFELVNLNDLSNSVRLLNNCGGYISSANNLLGNQVDSINLNTVDCVNSYILQATQNIISSANDLVVLLENMSTEAKQASLIFTNIMEEQK
jgi:hypothetical protein